MSAELFLTLLLQLYPPNPTDLRCIESRRASIVQRVTTEETRQSVPPSVLITVAFFESHLSCARGSGGGWGAPISASQRGIAGGAWHAARSLAVGRRRCGDWESAIHRFRSGRCDYAPPGYAHGYAMRVIRRVYSHARIDLPDDFPRPTVRR